MLAKIFRKNLKWLIVFICVIILLAIIEDIFEKETIEMDTALYKIIVLNLRSEPLTAIMKVITALGGSYVLIGLTMLSFIVIKNKKIGTLITSNLAVITLLNIILKNIIQRPRPEGYRLITESGYSFPSGHSMVSMAFYGLILYIIWKKVENRNLKYSLCALIGLLIPLIRI